MQNKEADPIETNRLLLRSLSIDTLRFLSERSLDKAQETVDYRIPSECSLAGHRQIPRRIRMIERDFSQHPWMFRAIVTKKELEMIGFISFHHRAPDPDLADYSPHGAELGYTVEKPHRRNGYARESAIGFMEWANREHKVNDFFLTISPENAPSLKMAQSMGFVTIGKHEDPEDGVEFVMKSTIEKLLRVEKAYQVVSDNADKPRV